MKCPHCGLEVESPTKIAAREYAAQRKTGAGSWQFNHDLLTELSEKHGANRSAVSQTARRLMKGQR